MNLHGLPYKEIFKLRTGDTVPVFYGKDKKLYRIDVGKILQGFDDRILNLETNVYKVTYFEIIDISATTTGSITLPAGAVLATEEFPNGAVLSQLHTNNFPNGEAVYDVGGNILTANFTLSSFIGNSWTANWVSNGNYAQPVALIFQLVVTAKDFKSLDTAKIIDFFITNEDKHYEFVQAVPSILWVITHNLNKFPSITVEDSSGKVVYGAEQYIDKDNLEIHFSAPFSGKAYLN